MSGIIWSLSPCQAKMPFDANKLYCSEILAILLQNNDSKCVSGCLSSTFLSLLFPFPSVPFLYVLILFLSPLLSLFKSPFLSLFFSSCHYPPSLFDSTLLSSSSLFVYLLSPPPLPSLKPCKSSDSHRTLRSLDRSSLSHIDIQLERCLIVPALPLFSCTSCLSNTKYHLTKPVISCSHE